MEQAWDKSFGKIEARSREFLLTISCSFLSGDYMMS